MDQSMFKVKVELVYPIGFQLHIITSENDSDNYKTKVISGLTEADVNFYLSFAKLFSSKNNRPNPGIGNEYQSMKMLTDMLVEHVHSHSSISQSIKDEIDEVKDDEYDTAHFITDKILGSAVDYCYSEEGEIFCRVFESFKILEIREPVVDVTTKFK